MTIGTLFYSGESALCLWDPDRREKNIRFLSNVRPGYFRYLAQTHEQALEGEQSMLAATALRTAYHQGLETLFTFLCGAFQAPHCIVAWIPRCTTQQLRVMVKSISDRRGIKRCLKVDRTSWLALAKFVFSFTPWAEDGTPEHFARLWSRFSGDFLNAVHSEEYNSLKHGHRVAPGGFIVEMGTEREYGVSPPEDEMNVVGSSEFGSSFFVPERIEGACRDHLKLRHQSVNWHPNAQLAALDMISLSLLEM